MSNEKSKVHGLGGVFFKARDPQALGAWYRQHLGLDVSEWGGAVLPWQRVDGGGSAYTVWSPFREDTTYFEPGNKPYMINFRVDDLDALLVELRAAGCQVLERREDCENGRFGYVLDPEGALIELWEPAAEDPSLPSTP